MTLQAYHTRLMMENPRLSHLAPSHLKLSRLELSRLCPRLPPRGETRPRSMHRNPRFLIALLKLFHNYLLLLLSEKGHHHSLIQVGLCREPRVLPQGQAPATLLVDPQGIRRAQVRAAE